jgi:hypothetical protein
MPSGVTIDALSNNAAINNAGQVAFIAGLSTHNLEYGFAESLWLADSSGMKILAVRGTQAPGTPSGVMFDEITYWPVLNDAGQVLFGTIFMGDGIDASNNSALYLSDAIGNIDLILRLGDHAPGTPAGTVFAPNDDGAFVLNNAGQVVVGQRLAGPEVDFSNDYGIWATDHEGDQQLIARKGDELELAPGDLRTISDLSFVGIAANSNGWPSAFNDLGQLVFWASFTDGTQGVFVSNKVAHIPGDFNNDGTVDAADYVVWRKTDGTQAGYDSWRANFGRTVAAGGSVAAATEPPVTTAAVPEPSAAVLVTLAIVTCFVTAIRELDADRGRRRCFAERRWHEEIG